MDKRRPRNKRSWKRIDPFSLHMLINTQKKAFLFAGGGGGGGKRAVLNPTPHHTQPHHMERRTETPPSPGPSLPPPKTPARNLLSDMCKIAELMALTSAYAFYSPLTPSSPHSFLHPQETQEAIDNLQTPHSLLQKATDDLQKVVIEVYETWENAPVDQVARDCIISAIIRYVYTLLLWILWFLIVIRSIKRQYTPHVRDLKQYYDQNQERVNSERFLLEISERAKQQLEHASALGKALRAAFKQPVLYCIVYSWVIYLFICRR